MIESSYQAVRGAILRALPDASVEVERYEREVWALLPGEDGWTDSLFDIIVWDYLEDAARRPDPDALRRAAELVDTLLREGDPEVQNLAVIGIVKPLAATPVLRDAFESFGMADVVAVGDRYNTVPREFRRRSRLARWLRR